MEEKSFWTQKLVSELIEEGLQALWKREFPKYAQHMTYSRNTQIPLFLYVAQWRHTLEKRESKC